MTFVLVQRGLRSVPMLIPNDCKSALAYLAETTIREQVGIQADSDYVFANSGNDK